MAELSILLAPSTPSCGIACLIQELTHLPEASNSYALQQLSHLVTETTGLATLTPPKRSDNHASGSSERRILASGRSITSAESGASPRLELALRPTELIG